MFAATQKLARLPADLYERPFAVGLALRDIRSDLLLVNSNLQSLAEAPTTLRLRRFQASVRGADERIEANLVLISERFGTEPALVSDLSASYAHWLPLRQRVIERVEAGDAATAYTLVKTEGLPLISELTARLDLLLAVANTYAENTQARNDELRSLTISGVLISMVVGLAGLFAITIFLRRAVITPTTEISEAIRHIADGNLSETIPHCDRPDEIGEIARSTKVFMDYAFAIQNWKLDWLTGLPARSQLHEHIQLLRQDPAARARPAALVHFDIDRFAETNDSFGREAGDALLVQAAKILREHSRIGDFVVRDSADSFVMLVVGMADLEDVSRLAGEICNAISAGLELDGQALRCTCSAGVAMCEPGAPIEEMLAHAASALVEAQKQGPGTIELYTAEMDQRLRQRRETLVGLKFALENDEIVPFFQPQVKADTGELTGFEALVRWNHPEQGVLSPWQFIDVALGAGLMNHLTDTMIAKSLAQLGEWRRRGFDVPRVSVNLGAVDLGRAGFVDYLMLQIERVGLDPADVCVELLETAMIEDAGDAVSRALDRLGELGVQIELDDFGTGHAAISTLHLVKLSGIKIDRSFITNLDRNVEQQHLTKGILRISNALQIATVAEGVENEIERDMLVSLGCESIQGFWVSPPLSAYDATVWLEDQRANPGRYARKVSAA